MFATTVTGSSGLALRAPNKRAKTFNGRYGKGFVVSVSASSSGSEPRKSMVSGLRPFSEQRARGVLHPIQRAAVEDQPTSSAADKELINNALGPVIEEMTKARTRTDFVAETLLPTTNGNFRVRAYRHWVCSWGAGRVEGFPTEPLAIVYGDVNGLEKVPVRVHDACFTSEVLGSMKCDCAEQLQQSLDYIKENGPGIVVYLQQEGRGIGLANKIAAYSLQQQGLDTVDANRALDLPDDCREYTAVANMLKDMNVKSIQLMTNNPRKVQELGKLDVKIDGRITCLVEGNEHSSGYLQAKMDRMDHMMDHLQ